MRITVVSDTHLSPRAPEAQRNWDAVVRHVAASAPDLVLHLGDLSLDGAGDPEDLRHARGQLDRLRVPWYVVPGNHDLGDNPNIGVPEHTFVSDERRRRWLNIVGPDHWCVRGDGWTLLAINAQLLGSQLAAEDTQWRWLVQEFRDAAAAGNHVALITHKPLSAPDAELAAAPLYRFVPQAARRHLQFLSAAWPFRLVASGHVHQRRVLDIGGTRHVWAPTTWAVLSDEAQPRLGTKRCGVVDMELTRDGAVRLTPIEPDGLTQLVLDYDLPSPYHGHHQPRH